MDKKRKKNKYYWQPEISCFVVYWSYTFGLLFIGLIILLESIGYKTLISSLIGLSLLFIINGTFKYFVLKEDYIIQFCFNIRRKRKIYLKDIQSISVGTRGFTFTIEGYSGKELHNVFLMKPKTLRQFVDSFRENPAFTGEIREVKKSEA